MTTATSLKVRLFALVAVLAAGACATIALLTVSKRAVESTLNPLGFRNLDGTVGYVGDKACASCHEEIAARYARTGMARSWAPTGQAEPVEEVPAEGVVVEAGDGLRYEITRAAGKLTVTEYRLDERGQRVHELVVTAAYVLGSGHKGRSYVADFGGHLQLLPVSWYSGPRKWALSPGYQHRNRRFGRAVVARCIACHNAYPEYVPYSDSRYRKPLPAGISCERCHGPGALHVEQRRQDPPNRPPLGKDYTIVNPAHLPSSLQQDVCLQCHLSTEIATLLKPGTGPFDFEPGQPLYMYRLDFTFAGREGEELSAVSHGTRLALSRCFTQTGGALSCNACHEAHRPSWEVPRDEYNAKCLQCHRPQQCSRPATPPETSVDFEFYRQAHRASDCISCHMPRRDPKDIQHTTTTDHWIRRDAILHPAPRPEGPPMPPPRYVALIDYFGVATPGERGVAHIMYGHTWQRADYLEEGLRLLAEARRADPRNPRWLYWSSLALADLGHPAQAYALCRSALQLSMEGERELLSEEERIDLYLDYVQYELQRGNLEAALSALSELLEWAPACLDALITRGQIELQAGKTQVAERLARRAVRSNPSKAEGWQLLATSLLLQRKDLDEALTAARAAARWNPTDPMPFLLTARVLTAQHRYDEARQLLEQTLRFFPRNLELYIALTALELEAGNRARARRYFELARERAPHDPRVQQLQIQLTAPSTSPQPAP